ncbi:MAG: YjbE family putative metal transport protein [Magnetococcales bacterium]|nr:YjbE family putative metal transport protein [Magnetococcales bacterium]
MSLVETEWLVQLTAFVQIVFIDLVLAGDNAIVVGMAAASVPPEHRRQVVVLGTGAAILLRIIFALITLHLLQIVGLRLVGGLLLVIVAWQMYRDLRSHSQKNANADNQKDGNDPTKTKTIASAVWQVALADLSMSLDNVLAVAGAAGNNPGILVAGLVLAVIMMAFAANYIAQLIHKQPWVAWIGLAIIFYVAMDMTWRGYLQIAPILNLA